MPLKANDGKSFIGSYVLGMGFVLSSDEAQELIARDQRNKNVLFPYLNGEDLNTHPEQKPSRWVINFFEWDEETAKSYPDCYKILEDKVKPERLTKNDQRGREKWWQFLRVRRELYDAISELDQVMVLPRVSKYFLVSIAHRNIIYSEATVVIGLNSFFSYAVLSSVIHEIWAWKNSSTMKGDALRYSASRAFETFPFPHTSSYILEDLGRDLHRLRKDLMFKYKIGMTDLQNIYHNEDLKPNSPYFDDILIMRQLHKKIDCLVLKAYNWEDMEFEHNFYSLEYLPENDRVRYTVGFEARKVILNKLLFLNIQRYGEELIADGEINKNKKKTSKSEGINLFSQIDRLE